jgi:hypothetical protein
MTTITTKIDLVLEQCVEVLLASDGDFLKIVETLERMGISSFKDKKIYPSVHILHKHGRYYLCHFKHLFCLEGGEGVLDETDWKRYYTICKLLESWGLIKTIEKWNLSDYPLCMELVKIIPYAKKHEYTIVRKFRLGKFKG